MTITKNENGYYEVRIRDGQGRIKSFSTHKKSRAEAQRFIEDSKLLEIERAAEVGLLTQNVVSVLIAGKRTKVIDALEPWKKWMESEHQSPMSIVSAQSWVNSWIEFMHLAKRPISSISERDIDPWINPARSWAGSKLSTRRVMLASVRSLIRFCNNKGWIQGNPANLVNVDLEMLVHEQKEVSRKPCFTNKEVELLIRHTGPNSYKRSPFWHAAVPLSRCLGLRLSDIACLEWTSISPDGKVIVWTKKRDKRVEPVALHPEWLKGALDTVERVSERYLFPVQRSIILDPAIRATLSTQFTRICKSVDIWGKSFHCLRASFISEMAAAGIPIEDISKAVGHTSGHTTRGYIRCEED